MPDNLSPLPAAVQVRTMADDLAAAARGEPLQDELGLPAGAPPSARSRRRGSGGVSLGLPGRALRGGGRRVFFFLVLGCIALVVAAGSVWVLLRALPRGTRTVADVVPAEATSFISVRGPQGASPEDAAARTFLDAVRERVLRAFGLPADRVAGATDIAYVTLPGSSPGEPVPALLVRGVTTVDVSAVLGLGTQSLRDGVLVVRSTDLGRLQALSGDAWGSDGELQPLLRDLPPGAPLLLAFRHQALEAVLKPVTAPAGVSFPLVLAVAPEGTGTEGRVVGRTRNTWSATGRALLNPLADKLPSSVILALQRDGATFLGAFLGGDDSVSSGASVRVPELAALHRALGARADSVAELRALAAGPGVLGVLPTAVPGVRDAVGVIPLRPGADPLPVLRAVEDAFRELGPALTGAPFPGAVFTEDTYAGVTLRYLNFGTPSRAFDYAVADGYLLLATSRESMRALVDVVRGTADSLAVDAVFAALGRPASESGEWLFLRGGELLAAEVPPAYAPFVDLLQGLLVRPAAPGALEGQLLLSASTFALPGEPQTERTGTDEFGIFGSPGTELPAEAAGEGGVPTPPAASPR